VHDLRRTAVPQPRVGGDEALGHETDAICRRYAIMSEAELADSVRRLVAVR